MGGFSRVTPKDYPTSPDIEDRRNEPKEQPALPEFVIRAQVPEPESDYQHARVMRKKKM